LAEKKKVEREFVEASTGKTGKRPAVVTAANKKSATGKRVAAVILWVLALAAEVGAILMLNGTWYIPEEQKMYWLIGALVIDLILVIIGRPTGWTPPASRAA
jgi:phenylacetate-coenzyme A ligase PaaK-like adenylate-forming protein